MQDSINCNNVQLTSLVFQCSAYLHTQYTLQAYSFQHFTEITHT